MEASTTINRLATYEPVEDFYSGKSVLITGGTGFLGKVLIEKLLYSCPKLRNIYVLVRGKKNAMPNERIKQMLDSKVFTRLKKEKPENLKKIIAVVGDITLPDLGLSEIDKTVVINEVSVTFHLAASIKFDEPLTEVMKVNVEGTRNAIIFSQKMKDLQAFIYMSTAFCNTDKMIVKEILYPPPMEIDGVNEFLTRHGDNKEKIMEILKGRPNTYAFTKAIAESLVAETREDTPTVIVRPSVVVAAMHEPIPGWIDTWLGPTPALDMVARGWLKCLYGKSDYAFDIIPVDYVINATIVAAARCRRSKNIQIFNCCTSSINKLSLEEVFELYSKESINAGYNDLPLNTMVFTKSSLILILMTLIFLVIPAYIRDFFIILKGKPPRYVKIMWKFTFYLKMIKFFSSRNWFMMSTRLRDLAEDLDEIDQHKFPCNPAQIKWSEFIPAYFEGETQRRASLTRPEEDHRMWLKQVGPYQHYTEERHCSREPTNTMLATVASYNSGPSQLKTEIDKCS